MSIHIGIKIQNITMLKSLSFKYPIKDETPISNKRLIPINCVIVLQIISINTNTIVPNVVFT